MDDFEGRAKVSTWRLIEALAKSGQGAAARAHGQAFLKNYANSPYAARVQQIVGAP